MARRNGLALRVQWGVPVNPNANALHASALAGAALVFATFAACGEPVVGNIGNGYEAPTPTSTVGGAPGSTSPPEAGAPNGAPDAATTVVDGAPPSNPQARALFEALLPALNTQCGGCHVSGLGGAPLWMGPPDPYTTARAYTGIVVPIPSESILITKGRHEGPALVDPLATQVLGWLTAEAASLTPTTLPTTAPFSVAIGANSIDLSSVAAGVAGTKLTFTASQSGTITQLANISIVAPSNTGVQVTYPIFVTIDAQGNETDDMSFSNCDQTFAAGQTAVLEPGLLLLTDWSSGDQMRVEFTALAPATASDGGAPGGCKSVASFTANAVPAIQQNTCLNCHNTGGSGNASLDLSALAATPPDDATACAQALNRINPQDPAQSDIILAPTGGVAMHPFKNASATYSQMMQMWIVNEQ